jgi:hypothetical protein
MMTATAHTLRRGPRAGILNIVSLRRRTRNEPQRNERDQQALVQSIAAGKIAAVAGVQRPNAIPGCRLAPVVGDAIRAD